MQWAVLGTLLIEDDTGTEVPVPAGRLRTLSAALLMRANQVVSVDELVDLVWDGVPPAEAPRTVRVYVGRLRRALGPSLASRIITRAPGYLCQVRDGELDLLRFGELCRKARLAARDNTWVPAAGLLDEALALWRGAPLADIPSDRLRSREVPRLAQLHLQAVEDHIDAQINLNTDDHLIPRLRDLVSQHPLREHLHAQLMRALARTGRRAEALEAYVQARQILADQLGVDPGPELRDLHLRLLIEPGEPFYGDRRHAHGQQASRVRADGGRQKFATTQRPAVPQQLPAGPPFFTGRTAELSHLRQMLEADGGTVAIAAIVGTPGAGKTALAVHWAHLAAAQFPDGQLYVNLRGFGPSGNPATPAEAIRGFLDALGAAPDRIPPGVDARAALYRSIVAGKRLLIVLDNARDEQQIRPLLPGAPGCLVLVTGRTQLTGLAVADGARLLTLDVLAPGEASQMLAMRLGQERAAAEPDAVDQIATLCARLPLALAIAAARAAGRPRLSLADLAAELSDARGRLDALDTGDTATSARALFSWSAGQLRPGAARMFRLLGLHPGPDITVPAAASLTAASLPAAASTLRELTAANLLAEHHLSRYACHDLLRAFAAEQAHAAEAKNACQTAIRRLLDHYLHTAHSAAVLLSPSRPPLRLAPALPGVTPMRFASHQQAMAWFEAEHHVLMAAVGLAAQAGFDVHAWQLPWAMADFLDRRGYWHDSAAIQRTALGAATRLDDGLGCATAGRALGKACAWLSRHKEARTYLTGSLALYQALGDRDGQARTHQSLLWVAERQARYGDALDHAQQALALFQATADQAGQAAALNAVGWCHALLGHPQQARSFCRQALGLNQQRGNRRGEALTWDSLGYAEHQLGNLSQAAACYQRALELFREFGDRFYEADILTHLGDTHHTGGGLEAARDAWQQALLILDDLQHPDADRVRAKLRALRAVGAAGNGLRSLTDHGSQR
jgi:DNA-binding SARP family transcriptional activator/tetratricopeptide (TPR) repeat protein